MIYLTGSDLIYPTNEIAYVKDVKIEIVSSADKGIADTSINGRGNWLYTTVTGTTTLKYYYSFYYKDNDGGLKIGTISSDVAKLYTISEDENPYIIKKIRHYKTVDRLTGLPSEEIYCGDSYYEFYVPESAIPTEFTYNLN